MATNFEYTHGAQSTIDRYDGLAMFIRDNEELFVIGTVAVTVVLLVALHLLYTHCCAKKTHRITLLAANLLSAAEEGHVQDTFPTDVFDRNSLLLGYQEEETIEVVVVPNIEGEEAVGPPAVKSARLARRLDGNQTHASLLKRTLVAEARMKFGLLTPNTANKIIVRRFIADSKLLRHKDFRTTQKPLIVKHAVIFYFTPSEGDLVEAEFFRLDRFKDLWDQINNGYGIMRGCLASPC